MMTDETISFADLAGYTALNDAHAAAMAQRSYALAAS